MQTWNTEEYKKVLKRYSKKQKCLFCIKQNTTINQNTCTGCILDTVAHSVVCNDFEGQCEVLKSRLVRNYKSMALKELDKLGKYITDEDVIRIINKVTKKNK